MNANKQQSEEYSSKNSDTSMSTKDSELNSKQKLDKTAKLVMLSENTIDANIYSLDPNSLLFKRSKNLSKKENQNAKEKKDKTLKIDFNACDIRANAIKITSYEEDYKEEICTENFVDECFSRQNFSITEKNISFEINFEKNCQKDFTENKEEFKPDAETDKNKEKDILINGNIDQLYDYIISNNNKNNQKKKNKKKKKNKNKNFKNYNNNNNSSTEKLNEAIYYENYNNELVFNNFDISNNNKKLSYSIDDYSKLYDAEVELFKQNIIKDNKKASDTLKIKPIFSSNWLEALN